MAGRLAVTVGGSAAAAGALAAKASEGMGAEVSCPPNARPEAEDAFCNSLCRWYASSARLMG